MQPASPNGYLERLNIPREQVERFLQQPDLNLFLAASAVLLAHGQPLHLSELAARLEARGFVSSVGDMEHSLLKAWHGQRPIYRDDADRPAVLDDDGVSGVGAGGSGHGGLPARRGVRPRRYDATAMCTSPVGVRPRRRSPWR